MDRSSVPPPCGAVGSHCFFSPGADLLIRANWDNLVADDQREEDSVPQLTGLGLFHARESQTSLPTEPTDAESITDEMSNSSDSAAFPAAEVTTSANASNPIYLPVIAVILVGFLVVALGTVLIKYRRTSTN